MRRIAVAHSQRTAAIKLPPGNDKTSKSTLVQRFSIAAPIHTAPTSVECFIAIAPHHREPSAPLRWSALVVLVVSTPPDASRLVIAHLRSLSVMG
jgi:hypothetical protein